MIRYNQNDFPKIPYPAKGYESATVKSSGCGVCCSATVLSFFGVDYSPDKLAPLFVKEGIRVPGGTDMRKAALKVCELTGAEYTTTSDESVLAEHLRSGGIAIANVGGDRSGWTGVFSSGGHYIVVLESRGSDFVVFDVGYYAGKYNSAGRKGKVTLEGDLQVCSADTLHMDTLGRTPNYYLFKKEEPEMTDKQFDEMMEAWSKRQNARAEDDWSVQEGHFAKAKALGIVSGQPKEVVRKDVLVAVLGRLGLFK